MTDHTDKLADLAHQLDTARHTADQAQQAADQAAQAAQDYQAAHDFHTQAALAVQQQVHAQVAGVVDRCLAGVFGPDAYGFQIDWQQTRGQAVAKLSFTRDGQTVDPMTASGGGVVDVASFALRVAALVLCHPPARRVLVLDEPFRFVSADYLPAVRQLLHALADDLGIQFIMVTHIPALQCGHVVEVQGG